MVSLHSWLVFLKDAGSSVGFPLVVGGLGLMLFGWRCWKICVMLAFGAIGAAVAAYWVGACDNQWLYALIGGLALGLLSFWPVNYAICVLGGLMGAGFAHLVLETLGLRGTSLGIAAGTAFLACTAYSLINRQRIVILTTSFLGAMLLLSGLTSWVMALPTFYANMRNLVEGTSIAMPFILIVPTVMSSFYQLAEVRRANAEL